MSKLLPRFSVLIICSSAFLHETIRSFKTGILSLMSVSPVYPYCLAHGKHPENDVLDLMSEYTN